MISHQENAFRITSENFAKWLGVQYVESSEDKAVVKLPYKSNLGVGRIHGGAISALIDIAATAAFWSNQGITSKSRGATVGFTVNFLKMTTATDLYATATVRRRGNTLCTGNVVVCDTDRSEIAIAVVTYRLQSG